MRIRKNANVSSLLISSSHASGIKALLQPHVCQLNQSPWDVIPLSYDTCLDDPTLPFQPKSEGEDSFNGTASLNDSISALESFIADDDQKKATMRKKMDELVSDDNGYKEKNYKEELKKAAKKKKKKKEEEEKKKKMKKKKKKKKGGLLSRKTFCHKNDGKGWHCKNQPMEGHNICEHHLLKCSVSGKGGNYGNAISSESAENKGVINGSTRPVLGKRGSSSSSVGSGNPYEFYYYSGFGPLWRKRRGGERGWGMDHDHNGNFNLVAAASASASAGGEGNVTSTTNTEPSSSISSPINEHREDFGFVFDYEFDDDDDDDDDNLDVEENGAKKRRMRKPVKARSLKSLM